jgi:hypothetical protein
MINQNKGVPSKQGCRHCHKKGHSHQYGAGTTKGRPAKAAQAVA